ncbi:hypothetical protein [Micromonospora aurantiaca (nom. illeg.)]|uniref:hypothetical protein n=1 Tax=Micromonospora aurantiaca (nom. illeg.) TaxID=47850 RepID=UPI003654A2E7
MTDDDRWGYLAGARFVGPDEWEEEAERYLYESLHLSALSEGLVKAADSEGRLIDWLPNEFYAGALSDALRSEHDPEDWKLTYDRFVASVLLEAMSTLTRKGLLAHRGNGDTADYRLALPAPSER